MGNNGCFTYTPAGYQGSDDVSSCAVKTVTVDVCQPTVSLPNPPTNLKVKALSSSKLELTWSDNPKVANSGCEANFPRKKNGKMRPLGIPTMFDRTLQALYKLALEPVSEVTADLNSYGFRAYRSTQDSVKQIWSCTCRKSSKEWIL